MSAADAGDTHRATWKRALRASRRPMAAGAFGSACAPASLRAFPEAKPAAKGA